MPREPASIQPEILVKMLLTLAFESGPQEMQAMPNGILVAPRTLLVALLLALAPAAALAQSAPPSANPPLAAPERDAPNAARPDSQPIPDVEMPTPQLPGAIEEDEEEEGEQAMPGGGCPYRGNKLELIV